uniref:Uncharacterized protein n=1 Tax=Anguilla anguilla TaxID=7936 RepID=A0A0E9U4B5_ANGAN
MPSAKDHIRDQKYFLKPFSCRFVLRRVKKRTNFKRITRTTKKRKQ